MSDFLLTVDLRSGVAVCQQGGAVGPGGTRAIGAVGPGGTRAIGAVGPGGTRAISAAGPGAPPPDGAEALRSVISRHRPGDGRVEVVVAGDLLPRGGPHPLARETLAVAVAETDDRPLAGLHGGYAVAGWEQASGTLTLLRDGLGRWPLYHATSKADPSTVLAGTSASAVARAAGRAGDLDAEAADEYWAEGFIRPTRTAFEGVHPVLPGERLRLSAADPRGSERTDAGPALTLERDRVAPADGPRCDDDDPAAVRADLAALFEEATRRLLHDAEHQQPVLTLSGGIDSTLVALLTARRRPQIRALTLGALVPLTQDEPWARLAARRAGVQLETVRPYLRPLSPLIARCVADVDQPLWPKLLAMYHALAEAHGHARVVITGDCADGVFLGGTDGLKWTRPSDRPVTCVPFGPPLPAWLGPAGRDQASNHAVGHLLARQYHGTRRLGLLARTPFVDWDVMSYARSIPKHVILTPGRTKAVLQDQLAGWPERFLNRPKMGFPFRLRWATCVRGELGAVAAQVSPSAVARFADRLPDRLRSAPDRWQLIDIFHHFDDVLRLVGWTAFTRGLGSEAA